MICPKCLVQMHQLGELGGGKASDNQYTTFEIKHCKLCDRKVVEFYAAVVIDKEKLLPEMVEKVMEVVEQYE